MASSTPHKARKKRKDISSNGTASTSNSVLITHNKTEAAAPAFPLVSFLWPARGSTSQWVTLPLILMVVGLFRWTTGHWGYSGFNTPHMFGDFEAQRHWMEITIHLPISQWYFYDLDYWGLDYPPLTAYHSWLLGKIGSFINPTWFAFTASRGFEHQLLKVYMRATVLISEYLVYIPAAVILNRKISISRAVSKWESSIALVAILMQPSTILIDHAHFQYNTVMLGFVLASISSIFAGRNLWACVFFVSALCFKQMALYYAPAIFAYLLGICVVPRLNVGRFFAIAIVTILSFAVIFAPLLLGALYDNHRNISPTQDLSDFALPPLLSSLPISLDSKAWYYPIVLQLTQSIHRIFPFARGVFEDKVANLWCTFHTFHKLHQYPQAMIQRVSLLFTIISILPACMITSLCPWRELVPWAMASTAWGFFLCSFQVHEKSVLLPLLPMTILLGADGGLSPEMRGWIGWANMLGAWTLFPLLKRDELRVPYAVLSLLWAYLLGLPPTSLSLYISPYTKNGLRLPTRLLHLGFYAVMLGWHVLEAFVEPPEGKPDLWVVLNVLVGAAGFGICYLWCTYQLILRGRVLEDYFGFQEHVRAGKEKKAGTEKKKQ